MLSELHSSGSEFSPSVFAEVWGEGAPVFPVPRHLPVQVANSSKELVDRASVALLVRPTLVIPRWGRVQGSRFEAHESALLALDGRAAKFSLTTVIPAFSLFSQRGEKFRRQLFESWHPSLVAYVAGTIDGAHPSLLCTVLCLNPASSEDGTVRFFEAPEVWKNNIDDVINDFRSLLRMKGGMRKFGFVLREPPVAGVSLAFRNHDPRIRERKRQLADFGIATPLGQVFEILIPPWNRNTLAEATPRSDGAARVLTGRAIQRGNRIAPDDGAKWVDSEPSRLLQAGDVVVRSVYGGGSSGMVWAKVESEDLPLVVDSSVIVLRTRSSVSPLAEDFVLLFLASRHVMEMVDGFQLAGMTRLTVTSLRELQVPIPDQKIETVLSAVQDARDRADQWSEQAQLLLDSIFDDDTAVASRQRILRESRVLRWRVDAGMAVEDLAGQVRSQFPYPIAYRWRVADSSASGEVTPDGYAAMLDAGEQVLAYCANIGLAVARASNLDVGAAGEIRKKLRAGHGPGMGDWGAILDELGGKKFQQVDQALGSPDLRWFCRDTDQQAARHQLTERRNDEAHNRRVDSTSLADVYQKTRATLLEILRGAEFLIDLPLLLIKSISWDSLAGSGVVRYRRLAGDHPVVPIEEMLVTEPGIEVGSLYIRDPSHCLHLLRPFLIAFDCPTCRNLSTFHIDKYSGSEVVVKSLEHGHAVEAQGMYPAFRAVGLLE